MGNNNEGGAFFAGLVIGGLVGAALALLMAPQSGEETRAQIRDRSLEYKDWAEEGYLDARQRAVDAGQYAQGQATTLQTKSTEAYERGRQSTLDAYEKGRQSAMDAFEKGKQSVTRSGGSQDGAEAAS